MPSLLRLLVAEDDIIPLLLGLAAVNGDLRLYTEYVARLCREGGGGAKRAACRYLSHLATVKEPLTALEKLAEELGGSTLLRDVVRALRLGIEPEQISEKIVSAIIAKLESRANTIDDVVRAVLEVLALTSTILSFAVMMSAFVSGSMLIGSMMPIVLTLLTLVAGVAAPSIMKLAAPRVPWWLAAATLLGMGMAGYALYARSLYLALASIPLSLLSLLYTRSWWRENRLIASLAVRIAESMQFGYLGRIGGEDVTVTYDVLVGAKSRVKSSLSMLLIDMLRLLPQEGSQTAARLLRSFAEFASRYIELAKSSLVKSIVYELIVALSMPLLTLLSGYVLNAISSQAVTAPLPLVNTIVARNAATLATLMNLPAIAYTLVASKIGRGTPLLPLFYPLPALLALLPLNPLPLRL